MEVIEICERACDLCDDKVTDEDYTVTKSFALTDWGVVCIQCWDNKIQHHEEFQILNIYVKSQKVDDEWIRRPLVLTNWPP